MIDKNVTVHRSKAEHVAQRLLDRIVAAHLKPGSSFATEAELLSQFNVSRPTMRESLRILESQGVLELDRARRRHHRASASIDLLAHGLSVFLRLHEVPFITVLKAREVIEPALAYEAALNGTDDDFTELESSIARMKALRRGSRPGGVPRREPHIPQRDHARERQQGARGVLVDHQPARAAASITACATRSATRRTWSKRMSASWPLAASATARRPPPRCRSM
jgi:DNA-binding FadR family transcriptional regulator